MAKTLKDVGRFRNRSVHGFIEIFTDLNSGFGERVTHFTSEFIVKLQSEPFIVNFISNYLTLSNELYTNNANNLSGGSTAKPVDDLDVNQSDECQMSLYKPNRLYELNKPTIWYEAKKVYAEWILDVLICSNRAQISVESSLINVL